MKRLLITGARGFIGRHCIAPAIEAGYEVHSLAFSSGVPPELDLPGTAWHVGDLLMDDVPRNLIETVRPTHILHAAWVTTHGVYWGSAENLRWVKAGVALAEAFGKIGGQRFVSIGTCAEYAWMGNDLIDAETPERPATYYGRMKLRHHTLIRAAAHRYGFTASTGRIFFAYGPYENPQRVIPYTCRQLISGQEARLSTGEFWRDFMHVEDAARGLIALVDSDIQCACNVSSGTPVLLANIIHTLGYISGRSQLIRLGALPEADDEPYCIAGSNDLMRSTGWQPRVPLDVGLRATYEWWRRRTAGQDVARACSAPIESRGIPLD